MLVTSGVEEILFVCEELQQRVCKLWYKKNSVLNDFALNLRVFLLFLTLHLYTTQHTTILFFSFTTKRSIYFLLYLLPSWELFPFSSKRNVKGMWTRVILSRGTWIVALIEDIDECCRIASSPWTILKEKWRFFFPFYNSTFTACHIFLSGSRCLRDRTWSNFHSIAACHRPYRYNHDKIIQRRILKGILSRASQL